MKLLYLLLLFILFTLFYGCSSNNVSETEECRADFIDAIESGDLDGALSILQDNKCKFEDKELITNQGLIYNLKAGFKFLDGINTLSMLVDKEHSYVNAVINFSDKASSRSLENLQSALETYSKISEDRDILRYCQINRKNLSKQEQDICFYAGMSTLFKSSVTFSMGLANEGNGLAKQTINKFLLQLKRGTFCTDDRNKNGVIDEIDAFICAIDYSNDKTCDTLGTFLSAKDIRITKNSKTYNFSLLKITVKSNDAKCSGYDDRVIYRLVDRSTGEVILTDGYCTSTYESCSEPDNVSCYPCPVIINKDTVPVIDTIVGTINSSYLLVWYSFNEPIDSFVAKLFRKFLKGICSYKPEYCICGRDDICTEEDLQIEEVLLKITDKAFLNYLQVKYEEED